MLDLTYDEKAVREFQDMLIEKGWLDRDELLMNDEYGVLGDVTYRAVYDVQLEANDPAMSPVMDENESFLDSTGNYYKIDEATYTYIMTKLQQKR